MTSSGRDIELFGQEEAEAGRVEHAGHADHLVARQSGCLLQRPDHGVEGVGDADDEGFGRVFAQAGADLLHDLQIDLDEVVAAHAWLARHAGGDDDHIGILDLGVFVDALELGGEALDRRGLRQVERLALGHAVDHVEDDDFAKLTDARKMGKRAADLTPADECNTAPRHDFPPDYLAQRLTNRLRASVSAKGWLNAIRAVRKPVIRCRDHPGLADKPPKVRNRPRRTSPSAKTKTADVAIFAPKRSEGIGMGRHRRPRRSGMLSLRTGHPRISVRAVATLLICGAAALSFAAGQASATSPSAAVPFKNYKVSCAFQQWTECRASKLYRCAIYKDCKTQCRGSGRRC